MLPVYNIQLKNIGSAKCVVCVTNPTVVGLLSHQPITLPVPPAHYVTCPTCPLRYLSHLPITLPCLWCVCV